MATIMLNVPDESLVSKVKQVCKMLRGVTSVKVHRPKSEDITKTAGFKEAMEDVRLGRVKKALSVDDTETKGQVPVSKKIGYKLIFSQCQGNLDNHQELVYIM